MRLLILFFCVWTTIAHAETLKVISGEHSDFTRIAVIMGRDIDVALDVTTDSAVLSFANGPHQIDLADAFRRIGRNRIADIMREGDNRLRVTFACACTPVLGRGGPGVVTLDVTDARLEPVSDPSTGDGGPVSSVTRPPQVAQLRYGGLPAAGGAANATLALPLSLQSKTVRQEDPSSQPDPETARGLQFQIARAVSQGLLESSHSSSDTLVSELSPTVGGQDEGPSAPRPGETSQLNIQVRTNLPVGAETDDHNVMASSSHATIGCLPAEQVDVAAWSEAEAFGQGLGQLQRDVYSESGRSNSAAALRLARYYLYFGMGAEARAILAPVDPLDEKATPILALAQIMDHGQSSGRDIFKDQAHCETPASLWAVLAYPDPTVTADAAIGAVTQAFTALPWHLKDSLGPVLVRRLRAAGNSEGADTILRIIKRATENTTPALQIEEAEVSLAGESDLEAIALLTNVTEANGQLAPEALVRMIDIEIAAGRPIAPETALLAESYALEYRRTPIADELWRVNVLAFAASGQFGKAFELLAEPRPMPLRADLWSASLRTLAQQASDLEFVHRSLNVAPEILAVVDPGVSNALAQRLLDLGFAPAAENFLTGRAEGDLGRVQKTLRARSALQQNRPRRAEAELTGLSGPDIDRLRAEARIAAGDYATSQQIFRGIAAKSEEIDAAFLAGDWSRLKDIGPTGVAEFGALALEPTLILPLLTEEEPLQVGRTLVSDSERTRAVVAEMLNRIEAPNAVVLENTVLE